MFDIKILFVHFHNQHKVLFMKMYFAATLIIIHRHGFTERAKTKPGLGHCSIRKCK